VTTRALSFLIVEDDDRVARILARTLERYGPAELATTCKDARTALDKKVFDAIVVDVTLPDGSGMEILGVARARDPDVAALVVSGRVDATRLAEAHALSAPFLLKPIDRAQLTRFAERARERRASLAARVKKVLSAWSDVYALTSAEAGILELAVGGVPRGEIPAMRQVASSTVKKQVQNLLFKTGDVTLEGAVNRVLRAALVRRV
jgi:DNA-binding NarL/FixJ family response regulator